MADNIEHIIFEQFRLLRNQIAGFQTEMRQEFGDVKYQINRLELALAVVRRSQYKFVHSERPPL